MLTQAELASVVNQSLKDSISAFEMARRAAEEELSIAQAKACDSHLAYLSSDHDYESRSLGGQAEAENDKPAVELVLLRVSVLRLKEEAMEEFRSSMELREEKMLVFEAAMEGFKFVLHRDYPN